MDTLQTECRCLPRDSLTPDNKCYQPYTRGPCDFGEWWVFRAGGGQCEEKKYCKRFDNWHWWSPDQRCYRQFTQVLLLLPNKWQMLPNSVQSYVNVK